MVREVCTGLPFLIESDIMARKKNNKKDPEERKPAEEYYKLHSQAVDDLVTANEENSPEVPAEELRKYQSRRFRISDTLKALLLKAWFNGAVCFFFFWGLNAYLQDMLDQLFVLGFAQGVITDLLVNNIFRFYAPRPGANDRWMMFPKKQLSGLFLNILYAYVVLSFVYMFYNVVNSVLSSAGRDLLGVGPILFGLSYLGFDMLFISLKHLFIRILNDAKKKV